MKNQRLVGLGILVTSLCLVSVVRGDQRPVLTTGRQGHITVTVPDIPGAVSVTVSLISGSDTSDQGTPYPVTITQKSADGNWRYGFPDVTSTDGEVKYIIEYQFPNNVYRLTGSQYIAGHSSLTPQTPSLSSGRYLRRRATTVLYDDFSSGHINPNRWKHTINTGWYEGSHQAMMYTPEHVNTYVRNGILYIRPTLTADTFGEGFLAHGTLNAREHWGSCSDGWCVAHGWTEGNADHSIRPIMSGMLRSLAHIRYGKVEIVAKMAKGDWFWNALWMMPIENFYGTWPGSGEIDLIECAGNRHLTNRNGDSSGIDLMGSSIHYGVNRDNHVHGTEDYRLAHSTLADAFRTYWVDWTENHIIIGVDDHPVFTQNTPQHGFYQFSHQTGHNVWASGGKNAPFDKPFNLIMNVHVGGNPFNNDNWHNHPYARPWNPKDSDLNQMKQFWQARHQWEPTWQGETAAMQIKSVKMQQY